MISCKSPLSTPVIMHLLDFWLWFQLSTHFCLVLVCFTLGRCFLLSTTRGLSCAWELSHCWPPIRWVFLPRSSLPRCFSGGGEGYVWKDKCKNMRVVLSSFTLKINFKISFLVHPQLMTPCISNLLPTGKRKTLFHTTSCDLRGSSFIFFSEICIFKSVGFYLTVKPVQLKRIDLPAIQHEISGSYLSRLRASFSFGWRALCPVMCFAPVDTFVAPSPATTASPAKVDSSGVIDLFGGAYLSTFNTHKILPPPQNSFEILYFIFFSFDCEVIFIF